MLPVIVHDDVTDEEAEARSLPAPAPVRASAGATEQQASLLHVRGAGSRRPRPKRHSTFDSLPATGPVADAAPPPSETPGSPRRFRPHASATSASLLADAHTGTLLLSRLQESTISSEHWRTLNGMREMYMDVPDERARNGSLTFDGPSFEAFREMVMREQAISARARATESAKPPSE